MLSDASTKIRLRILSDPLAHPTKWPSHNPAQIRFIDAAATYEPLTIATFGNGTGKTHDLVSIWSALMFGTKNPLFQKLINLWPKHWPREARLCAPESLLGDSGVIQRLIAKLFPHGKYYQAKNRKTYHSQGETTTGWKWDVMTYNQAPLQAAGESKGLVMYTEPPPKPLFVENLARTRAGGITLVEETPLHYASWMKDEYIDVRVLKTEKGKVVGKINHVVGSIWDNCDEVPGGRLTRDDIERTISLYPVEDRELRVGGGFGVLQGLIFKTYKPTIHEIDKLPQYHRGCFDAGKYTLYNVMDPHDRKPYAIGWYAVFPNNDIVVMSEFPDDTYPPFHQMLSFPWRTEDYCEMMRATETDGFGKPAEVRWIDPNFGETTNFSSKKTIRQELHEWGQAKRYPMSYGLPVDKQHDKHMAVRGFLGDPDRNIRPKIYVMSHCLNHIFGFTHYAYKENTDETKGIGETPQLIHKDFMDLMGYLCVMNPRYIEPQQRRGDLWIPKKHWKSKN